MTPSHVEQLIATAFPASRRVTLLLAMAAWAVLATGAQAGSSLGECDDLTAADPAAEEGPLCYYQLARDDASQKSRAADRLRTLLATGPPDNVWGHLHLANILYVSEGPVEEVLAHYDRAAALFADSADFRNQARALLNKTAFLLRHDREEDAAECLAVAHDAALRAGDDYSVLRVQMQRARLLRRQGTNLALAYRILHDMEDRLFPNGDSRLQADWANLLGVVAHHLGRREEAAALFQRHLGLVRRNGDAYSESLALGNLAAVKLEELPSEQTRSQARAALVAAVEHAHATGNREVLRRAWPPLGRLVGGPEGRELLDRCVESAERSGIPLMQALCLYGLASLLVDEDPAAAARVVQQALGLEEASDQPWEALYGIKERLRVAWTTLPAREALERSRAELRLIKRQRALQPSEESRFGVLGQVSDAYYWLAGYLLSGQARLSRRETVETAFDIMESLRGSGLEEQLLLDRPATGSSASGRDVELVELRDRIVEINRLLLLPTLDSALRLDLLAELETLELLENELTGGLDASYSAEFEVGLTEVEAALEPHQALLSFQLALDEDIFGTFAGGSWLLASTLQGTRVHRLPDRVVVEPAIARLLEAIGEREDTESEASVELYRWLLAAAIAELPPSVEELVLVPDGALHRLPFGALKSAPGAPRLAEEYRLSAVPSAALWNEWRQRPERPEQRRALAFAAPEFAPADPQNPSTATRAAAEERDWWLGSVPGPLPGARREGRALRRQLGSRSEVLVGAEASEWFLKGTDLSPYRLIHFAAHAIVDDLRPQRSAILLTPGGDEDGLLQVRDIAALDLTGKIIVASACRSASGKLVRGEGVVGIARACFQSGAEAVIGNLWPVRDDDAEAYFRAFYRHLARGASLAEAMQKAQETFIRSEAPVGAWGGYVLLGNGDLRPFSDAERETDSRWIAAAFVAVLLLVAVVTAIRGARLRRGPARTSRSTRQGRP